MASCTTCNNPLPAGASSCEVCGAEVRPPPPDGRKTRVETGPSPGTRVTRIEPSVSASPPVSAPKPPRTSGGSPFDRAPSRDSGGGGAFDRAPRATTPAPRSTIVPAPAERASGEPIAGVIVAYRTPTDAGTLHRLRFGRNTIGRAPSNDVVLDDDSVSENHAFVFLDPGSQGARFLDVSMNGSLVDGARVSGAQADLVAGTTMIVGTTVLVFTPLAQPAPTVWGLR